MAICADDFGITKGISNAILSLVAKNRINAVSCMMTFPSSEVYEKLNAYKSSVEIGLHFNLTDFKGLTGIDFPSFKKWYLISLFNKKHFEKYRNSLKEELSKQYKEFESRFGFEPHYLDYHHHLQLIPFFKELAQDFKLPIRTTDPYIDKRDGIFMKIKKNGLTQDCKTKDKIVILSDSYNLNQSKDYLSQINFQNKHLLLHPGVVDSEIKQIDSLLWQRERDYNLLDDQLYFEEKLKGFLIAKVGDE